MSVKGAEKSAHPLFGLHGPTFRGEMLKRSDHTKEWRGRYFFMARRRVYYYDNEEEAPAKGTHETDGGDHKGWTDMVGATVSEFIDKDDNGTVFYGVQVQEEYDIDAGEECEGQVLRMCSSLSEERNEWVKMLKLASRPTWLDEKTDPRAKTCMESTEPFGMMSRPNQCRRCGGVFLKAYMGQEVIPELLYIDKAVPVCKPCADGKKHRSRFNTKIPKGQRPTRKKAAAAAAADKISSKFKGFRRKVKEKTKTVTDEVGLTEKLPIMHSGWMTKLGAIIKNWKRRWFVLDGESTGLLSYYKEQEDEGDMENAAGCVDMREVTEVKKDDKDENRIHLITEGRTYQFRCESSKDRDVWFAFVERAQKKYYVG